MNLALFALLQGCTPAPPPPPKQPDIVLVVIDTLRADHLGAYGYARPTSPNLDALAARGALFERAYSHAGWTLASFGSLFTGLYPHEHHAVRDPEGPARYGAVADTFTTLAESLQQAGYATAAVVNNAFMAPEHGLAQGFETYDFQGVANLRNRSATETVAIGTKWLETQEKPAFLLLHFMEPHLPYGPPQDLRGTFAPRDASPVPVPYMGIGLKRDGPEPEPNIRDYVISLYDEEVLTADRALGDLVKQLDQRDAWGETLLVVTADHGEEFWDHGGFEHGHTLYGELLRVPLVIAGAGAPRPGRFDTLVEHVDLYQGLIARGGATAAAGARGQDLWSLVGAPNTDRLAFAESVAHGANLASVADANARLVVSLKSRALEAWIVAPDKSERVEVGGAEQEAVGRALFRGLFDRRGGMGPLTVFFGPEPARMDVQAQLQALGYLEGESAGPE